MPRFLSSGRRHARRGIYLISTLLLLMFVVMLGGAVIVSFQQGLASSGNFQNRQLALQAATAGLQYLQARMETNAYTFRAAYVPNPNPRPLRVADGSFQVTEQLTANGGVQVFGLLTNDNVAGPTEGRIPPGLPGGLQHLVLRASSEHAGLELRRLQRLELGEPPGGPLRLGEQPDPCRRAHVPLLHVGGCHHELGSRWPGRRDRGGHGRAAGR